MGKNRKVLALIPARYASTRFPGKPLALIGGKSMLHRTYDRARSASGVDHVAVATDDESIAAHVRNFGGEVIMTGSHHASGTDRIAEAALQFPDFEWVLNVQGDEPFIDPLALNGLISFSHKGGDFSICTLAAPMADQLQARNPNKVKVVFSRTGKAMYFSRSAIPHLREPGEWNAQQPLYYQHLGIYLFRRQTLQEICALPYGKWEQAEKLEQLRWLEEGYLIGVHLVAQGSPGVDTPEDLAEIERLLNAGELSFT